MRRFLGVLALMGAGMCLDAYVRSALASRNSSGTMSAVNGPYVSGTVINSATVNARLADIETEVTDSLDRSGKGGMLAATRGIDGTVAAPAFSWTSETGSGLFRNGASDVRMCVSGAAKTYWGTSGFGIGAAPTTLLQVQGAPISSNKGQVWVKGISDHGYISIDTDSPTTKETALNLNSNGSKVWEIYIPANSSDLRFYNGADRVIMNSSGLTVGASGTAISASIRGTVSWTPGTINSLACTTNTITVTGATAGTECLATSPSGTGAFVLSCYVTSNTCNLSLCNPTSANSGSNSGTYVCRVFNP